MKKLNWMERIRRNNELENQIRLSNKSGSHIGCFRYFPNNTDAHENIKFEVYKRLIKSGFKVWTEAIFKSGKRADIVAIRNGWGYIIEVETPKTPKKTQEIADQKAKIYPPEFDVIIINTNNYTPKDNIGIE